MNKTEGKRDRERETISLKMSNVMVTLCPLRVSKQTKQREREREPDTSLTGAGRISDQRVMQK